MRLWSKSLTLVSFVAFCIIVVPALSTASENGYYKGYHDKCMNATRPIVIVQAGNGFAMDGTYNHPLKMSVMSKLTINSTRIGRLISENKTLGEIEHDIKAELISQMNTGSPSGNLRLGQVIYRLINIKSNPAQNGNYTLDADIAEYNATQNITNTIGTISVALAEQEGTQLGKGTLIMNGGRYSGKYNVLLNMNRDGLNIRGRHHGRMMPGAMRMHHEAMGTNSEMMNGAWKLPWSHGQCHWMN